MSDRKKHGDLKGEIEQLADLPRDELIERWQQLFDRSVLKGMSRRLIILAVAYEMQAECHGGLSAVARRRLRDGARLSNESDARSRTPNTASVSVGSRLVREWNGRNHVVDAVDGGFLWQGCTYPSLTAVARAITGAKWSGPRFFGLVTRGKP